MSSNNMSYNFYKPKWFWYRVNITVYTEEKSSYLAI